MIMSKNNMEKIYYTKADGKPYVGYLEQQEMLLKINEIVDWIKKHEIVVVKDKDWLLGKLAEIEQGK